MREARRVPALLAEEWRLARAALPDASETELVRLIHEHAAAVAAAGSEDPTVAFCRRMAAVALDRATVVLTGDRLSAVVPVERAAYEELIRLRTEVVPERKVVARRLRREMMGLEREARSRGLDPEAVEPRIGADAIALDGDGPRYETDEDRRRAVAEFFGRTGGGR